MLNFNQLRTFYQAARYLNFSVAAKNLFVSQPAVTAQIKSFEEFCKLNLFEKKGRKMHLTDEGQTIFRHSTEIFEREQDLEKIIYDLRKQKRGFIRIGTTKIYARFLMPILLTPFHRSFPGVTIELNEGSSLEMIESLLNLINSMAIVAKVKDNPNIEFIPLAREEIILIVAPQHHLASRDEISFEELLAEPIAMKEIGSGTRKLVEECFGNKRERLNVVVETSNVEFIKELVKQGEGISFLVRSAVERELTNGELLGIPIKDRKLSLSVCLALLRDYPLSLATRAFLDFLRPAIQNENPHPGINSFLAEMSIRMGIQSLK